MSSGHQSKASSVLRWTCAVVFSFAVHVIVLLGLWPQGATRTPIYEHERIVQVSLSTSRPTLFERSPPSEAQTQRRQFRPASVPAALAEESNFIDEADRTSPPEPARGPSEVSQQSGQRPLVFDCLPKPGRLRSVECSAGATVSRAVPSRYGEILDIDPEKRRRYDLAAQNAARRRAPVSSLGNARDRDCPQANMGSGCVDEMLLPLFSTKR